MASVVSIRPAIETAFWMAKRTTLVGSMTPASMRFSYFSVAALKPVSALQLLHLGHDHVAFLAGVGGDPAQGLLGGAADDLDADPHVVGEVLAPSALVEGGDGAQQGDAAAGDDAFLDRRLGGVHGVLDPGLLLLHLRLGGRAHLDHGHAAHQLGQPLLQLLAVVVGGRLLDLGADLLDPALDVLGVARALDDGGVVLVDGDLLGPAEVLERTFSSLMPRSSVMALPPVRIAMSSSMALRRSP